jgi:protein gp37
MHWLLSYWRHAVAEKTGIEWCDHTFNPWTGCMAVSPACKFCYAEAIDTRFGRGDRWGPHGEPARTAASNWQQPIKWNAAAEAAGVRRRVFCASMADVFDNRVPRQWRNDLWELIARTRYLDWLLLTKRPQNIAGMLPVMNSRMPEYKPWGECWPWRNVWFGTTAENQVEADRRIPHLLAVPAAKRFLSCEPLLGSINLRRIKAGGGWYDALAGWRDVREQFPGIDNKIDWVICGGESGPHARPMHPDWARDLRDQCAAAEAPFFFKQWGEWREFDNNGATEEVFDDDIDDILRMAHKPAFVSLDGRFFPTQESVLWDTPVRVIERLGKKAAGALFDGVEHKVFPK